MKKQNILPAAFVLLLLLLAGCGARNTAVPVTAFVEAGEHYTLEVPAVSVAAGESAAFYIQTDPGYQVTETDYDGTYQLFETRGMTKLVLENVRYPTRVKIKLSFDTRTIRYFANGGTGVSAAGTDITRSYDVSYHIRPNVSIGTDLFEREGYTLIGWNTEADGTGTAVGLGSRMTVDNTAVLYAQWVPWTDEGQFLYEKRDGSAVIIGYIGNETKLVIPERLGDSIVETIAKGAFTGCGAQTVILPKTLKVLEDGAFRKAELQELWLFDNIETISDACFTGCKNLSTLHISAIEDPSGFSIRRESVWVDKLDMLITTMGEKRIIFYGGCSMWYNFLGAEAQKELEEYRLLNMGLNGVVSSLLQMEMLLSFTTENDILVHTPEISSKQQLMLTTGLFDNDTKLWCALEYNYDLVALLDLREFEKGVFNSFCAYLEKKQPGGSYSDIYHDSKGREFLDPTGSVPFIRVTSADELVDTVDLDPKNLRDLSRLAEEYRRFTEKGIPIYVSYACIDIDRVPEEHRENLDEMGVLYTERFSEMPGVTVISDIHDFIYHDTDCYDTVYHLLSEPAQRCTLIWMRDLTAQLIADGLLER